MSDFPYLEFPDLLEKTFSGNPQAYKTLAYKYYEKDSNSRLAFDWFHRAAQAGDAEAQYMVGVMYFFGQARAQNLNSAVEWLLKSYEQGFGESLIVFGWLHEDGYDFSESPFPLKSAESCYDEALNKYGIETAKDRLGKLRHSALSQKSASADAVDHLKDLIGLAKVKQQIDRIEKRAIFDKRRTEAGLENFQQSHHFVFIGNPGSGKTEVARLIGQLYKKMGILSSGHLIEVEREDLVAGKVGQTASKTREAINKALNGVLFIDEAHMLFDGWDGDFGLEAISTLVKFMEDYRDRLIVILAGYPDAMRKLLRSNPGLKSRIRHHVSFDDYSWEELVQIYLKFAHDAHFILQPDAQTALSGVMKQAVKLTDKNLGNGRFARNVFEKTIEKMAVRIVQSELTDKESLQTILFMDIPTFEESSGQKNLPKIPA